MSSSGLRSILWLKERPLKGDIASVFVGVIVLALASQISIPWQPVPLTFQSVTVLALGMLLGARLGTYTVVSYLIAGAIGVPVFADFSMGLHVFFGPTAGYLFGFVPAVWVSGYLAQKGLFKTAAGLGTCIIFAAGFLGLAVLMNSEKAWMFGVKPFLITESVKAALLAVMIPRFWKRNEQ